MYILDIKTYAKIPLFVHLELFQPFGTDVMKASTSSQNEGKRVGFNLNLKVG